MLFGIMFFVTEKEMLAIVSYTLHDIFTACTLIVMMIVLVAIPYWIYRFIITIMNNKDNIWKPIHICALILNLAGYMFLRHIVYKPFVNWTMVILLIVFYIMRMISQLKNKSKIIATILFIILAILGVSILLSPYYNPFDIMSDYDKKIIKTKFGDKMTFVYEEYNFPDLSCSLTITDSECEEPVYMGSDPPKHSIELREITQVDNENIYLSNGMFLIKDTEKKEINEQKIEDIIPEDAFEAYEKCEEVLKVFICSGSVDWIVDYADPFIINGDCDVINTVINIGNADILLPNEPNWVDVESHINAMYREQINVMRPAFYDKNEDVYNAVEDEDAVIYCKGLIEKYNLEYVGINKIHDNCMK